MSETPAAVWLMTLPWAAWAVIAPPTPSTRRGYSRRAVGSPLGNRSCSAPHPSRRESGNSPAQRGQPEGTTANPGQPHQHSTADPCRQGSHSSPAPGQARLLADLHDPNHQRRNYDPDSAIESIHHVETLSFNVRASETGRTYPASGEAGIDSSPDRQ